MTVKELIIFLLDKKMDDKVVIRCGFREYYDVIDVWDNGSSECFIEGGEEENDED